MPRKQINRRNFLCGACVTFAGSVLSACSRTSGQPTPTTPPTVTPTPAAQQPIVLDRSVAINNVCAWPNLTLMPDGSIAATIFNQPTHWRWPGDIECWVSADGGQQWKRRGQVTHHEPDTARGNISAGLAHDGALVIVVSGWSYKGKTVVGQNNELDKILDPWVCRSTDGGSTWEIAKEKVAYPSNALAIIPFGDIVRSPDGALAMSVYSWDYSGSSNAYFLRSTDDGYTWDEPILIGLADYNETDLLYLEGQRWLAASRTGKTGQLKLFASDDGEQTWTDRGLLTEMSQHPADLLLLADGRILLVYGNRTRARFGVDAQVSEDEGETWGEPMQLVDLEGARDGGYPSSEQLSDGTIITAYYADSIETHPRYHMGVVSWRLE